MKGRVTKALVWAQAVASAAIIVISFGWLLTDVAIGVKIFWVVSGIVFGASFLIEAVRLLRMYRQMDEQFDAVDIDTAEDPTVPGKWYICFPDGLRLIMEGGKYVGWYTQEHKVVEK